LRLLLLPGLLKAAILITMGWMFSFIHMYFFVAAIIIGVIGFVAYLLMVITLTPPAISIDTSSIRFADISIPLHEIVQLKFSKVQLTGLQRLCAKLSSDNIVYYHLIFQCSEKHVMMPYLLEETLAEQVAWLIVRTTERSGTNLITITTAPLSEVNQRIEKLNK